MKTIKIFALIFGLLFISCNKSNDPNKTEAAPVLTKYAGKVENLSDFETSPFFAKYNVIKKDGWKLQDGGFNNTYYVNQE